MAGTWAEGWERPVVALSTRIEISATPPATTRSASPTSSVALLREIRLGLLLVSIHLPISGAIRVYTVLRPSGRYVGAQCIAPIVNPSAWDAGAMHCAPTRFYPVSSTRMQSRVYL